MAAGHVRVTCELWGIPRSMVVSADAPPLARACAASSDAAQLVASALAAGADPTGEVEVLHVDDDEDCPDDDMPEDVSPLWLATVSGNFAAARALLDAGADAQGVVVLAKEAVRWAAKQGGCPDCDALAAALRGGHWRVPMAALLLDPRVDSAQLDRLLEMGFCAGDYDCVVPDGAHDFAALFAAAAAAGGLPVDADSVTPFQEGGAFCPADLAVLRAVVGGSDAGAAAAALTRRRALGESLSWFGHVLWQVSTAGQSDEVFAAVVEHPVFWAYCSEKAAYVGRDELARRRKRGSESPEGPSGDDSDEEADGSGAEPEQQMAGTGQGIVCYTTRIERYADEVLRQLPKLRQRMVTGAIAARAGALEDSSGKALRDPVDDSLRMVAAMHAAQSAEEGGGEPLTLQQQFDAACLRAKSLKGVKDADKLVLYSLFKQATQGDCDQPKPGMLDFAGKAKWEAWKSRAGLGADDARSQYVAAVARLALG